MEVIGSGFLAGRFADLAGSRPGVVVAAFGVSVASGIPEADFTREATRLYELIRRCERREEKLVFFSTASAAMYAVPGEPGREDGPVFPSTAYGRHNLTLEAVLAASRVDYLALRLAHVVGPAQHARMLVPSLVRQIQSGAVRLYRGARRDLVDVDDLVDLTDRLLATGVSRTVVNVATGSAVPVERIVDHLEAELGVTADRAYVSEATSQPVSVARLRHLVPEAARIGGEDYYRDVLGKYFREYAATTAAAG
ncbi:NAD-dependent epimerase/dehydratase family protein [Amycolatopsis sp. PS_44_ISF1]|uniref:NAD-dependent epimerase/dehydratase family protein n=1 Tax=Amycolatopsis sp. PS_44_ISF1 TaxID=2974917 RepID=UPI0028DF4FE4|nr:NAD-dependent epimerase/dehydratase family protein [Amycolatopsis sp. PS_44_ISF1]MDT8909768.1 NAD-dependent epimerase/dehydratase family protein [Amycolatopsis sp. PS_44_ISF1]